MLRPEESRSENLGLRGIIFRARSVPNSSNFFSSKDNLFQSTKEKGKGILSVILPFEIRKINNI